MKTCRHIKTNGRRCRSPRLGKEAFCYFHGNSIGRKNNMVQQSSSIHCGTATYKPIIPPLQIAMPVLEDADAIQFSISMVVTALATDRIDPKRAAIMLYGLQIASTNVRNITPPEPEDVVQDVVERYDGSEIAPEDEDERKPAAQALPESTEASGITDLQAAADIKIKKAAT